MNEDRTMNPHPISPEDSRLTAYALGEMEAGERTAFEQLLAQDPAARQTMEEIRAFAGTLGGALAAEPAPDSQPVTTESLAKAAIIAGRDPSLLDGGPRRPDAPGMGQLLRFPQMYYVTAGLAAACFAVFFLLQESRTPSAPVAVAAAEMRVMAVPAAGAAPRPAMVAAKMSVPVAANVSQADAVGMVMLAESILDDRYVSTADTSVSSFPLQVSHESYTLVRDQLRRGVRPAPATVRVAQLVNAFDYHWPVAAAGEAFATVLEEAAAPWAPEHRLVRVGLKGRAEVSGPFVRDARVQVRFNPARVQSWRLIGFGRKGAVAGVRGLPGGVDLEAGVAVTALYEIVPEKSPAADAAPSLLLLTLDYADAASEEHHSISRELPAGKQAFPAASADFRFAATVAAFGLKLEGAPLPGVSTADLVRWARDSSAGESEREEFTTLIPLAGEMSP